MAFALARDELATSVTETTLLALVGLLNDRRILGSGKAAPDVGLRVVTTAA